MNILITQLSLSLWIGLKSFEWQFDSKSFFCCCFFFFTFPLFCPCYHSSASNCNWMISICARGHTHTHTFTKSKGKKRQSNITNEFNNNNSPIYIYCDQCLGERERMENRTRKTKSKKISPHLLCMIIIYLEYVDFSRTPARTHTQKKITRKIIYNLWASSSSSSPPK